MCGPRDIEHKQGISCQYPPSWIIMSMLSESGYSRWGFYGVCEAGGGGSAWGVHGFEVDVSSYKDSGTLGGKDDSRCCVPSVSEAVQSYSSCTVMLCTLPRSFCRPPCSLGIPLVLPLSFSLTYTKNSQLLYDSVSLTHLPKLATPSLSPRTSPPANTNTFNS